MFASMAKIGAMGLIAGVLFSPAFAQQPVVAAIQQGCARELATYCKDVSPGEGRVASCLYAYEDKLSLGCAIAVYNGILDLEKANKNLRIYARDCRADLMSTCADVVPGGGRLYGCLVKNKAVLIATCGAAVKKAEPEMRKLGIIK